AVLMSGGLAVSAAGYFLLAGVGAVQRPLPLVAVGTFVLTVFASPGFTLTNDGVIGSAPPDRAGGAAGVSEDLARPGGARGIGAVRSGSRCSGASGWRSIAACLLLRFRRACRRTSLSRRSRRSAGRWWPRGSCRWTWAGRWSMRPARRLYAGWS